MSDIGAPDERAHANYVIFLLREEALPILDPKTAAQEQTYEMHQPPAYYVAAAAWARLFRADLESRKGGVLLRLFGVACSLISGLGIYFGTLWALRDPRSAQAGMAATILLPMFAAVNGWINNDGLLIALCVWSLALAFRCRLLGWSPSRSFAIAALLGTALLTKTSALSLVPPLLLALLWKGGCRPRMTHMAIVFGVGFAIVLPWWLRNASIYGDLLGIGVFREQFGENPYFHRMASDPSEFARWIYDFSRILAMSFVGMFGYMHILLPMNVYFISWLAYAALVIGWVLSWRSERSLAMRANQVIVLVAIATSFLLLVRFNLEQHQPQARYLFPALSAMGIVFGSGLTRIFQKNSFQATIGLVVLLGLLNCYALSRLPGEFQQRTSANLTVSTSSEAREMKSEDPSSQITDNR